jgi:hypothetical protein
MLSIHRGRIVIFFAILALASGLPIIGYYLQHSPSVWYDTLALIFKLLFPLQIFPIFYFLFDLAQFENFWLPYALYLFFVYLFFLKIARRKTPILSVRNIVSFSIVCAIFYVLNEAIFLYQVSNIFQTLPEVPVVQ